MAQQNLRVDPRERLPKSAPQVLDSSPRLDLHFGRFFITEKEFDLRLKAACFKFWKIQAFSKFVTDNHQKIREKHLAKDFLTKGFVDPKGMFRTICRQQPFEFLIMFDFCRQKKQMISKILLCSCYKEEFLAAGNECIKESIHFKCKCQRKRFFTCFSARMILLE